MYNPDLLIELIKTARGARTLNKFEEQCDINPGNLSRLLNNKNSPSPKPDVLKKIADNGHGNVSYKELMNAAGYTDLYNITELKEKTILSIKDEHDIEKKFELFKKDLLSNTDDLILSGNPVSQEAINSIIDTLSYGINQAKILNKKYIK